MVTQQPNEKVKTSKLTAPPLKTATIETVERYRFNKQSSQHAAAGPYREGTTNIIYNLLFCDNINLIESNKQRPYPYPFDKLFLETWTTADFQKIKEEHSSDGRIRALAYHRQLANGHKPDNRELLAVIVEVGLDAGPDVLASFKDGTARYINQSGKILVWETADQKSNGLTHDLFLKSQISCIKLVPGTNQHDQHPQQEM